MALSWGTGINLKGQKGDAGQAGSQLYFGTGTPAAAVGVTGDAFFATDTSYFYQKTSAGWPSSGTLLQGKMGLTGVNGASFYSGPSAPTSTSPASPNKGDLYLNLGNGEIYKYDGTTWGDQGYSLVGPQGSPGTAGSPGVAGKDGLRGSQIYNGTGAPTASTITSTGAQAGDYYLDNSTGLLYQLSGS